MILNSLDGAAIATRDAIVARARVIDTEWTEVVYDDPRGITSSTDVLALARATNADFVCMVLVSDMSTDPASDVGRARRQYEFLIVLAQVYGEGAGADELIGRAEKLENRMGSAPFTVTLGSDTFEMAVIGLDSAEPFSVIVDDNGGEVLGIIKALTLVTEIEVCP